MVRRGTAGRDWAARRSTRLTSCACHAKNPSSACRLLRVNSKRRCLTHPVVQNRLPLRNRRIGAFVPCTTDILSVDRGDQCLARIGLLGTDWLAGPAVAFGSAVNEVDWASTVVDSAISAWHGLVPTSSTCSRRTRCPSYKTGCRLRIDGSGRSSLVRRTSCPSTVAISAWH